MVATTKYVVSKIKLMNKGFLSLKFEIFYS